MYKTFHSNSAGCATQGDFAINFRTVEFGCQVSHESEQEKASDMNDTLGSQTTHAQEAPPTAPSNGAVTTVRKDDAVTTDASGPAAKIVPKELFVANVDGKYVRFEKLEHVPAGCRTYTNREELLGQTQKQVEAVYCHVKGIQTRSFKDKETAADNLWNAFAELPLFVPKVSAKTDSDLSEDAGKTEVGKKKYQKKREVDIYKILVETDKSKKLIAELAPQAQAVVEIIRADGKLQYTEDELKALMDSHKGKLRTKQTAWRIFQYYRGKLIGADVLVQQ